MAEDTKIIVISKFKGDIKPLKRLLQSALVKPNAHQAQDYEFVQAMLCVCEYTENLEGRLKKLEEAK